MTSKHQHPQSVWFQVGISDTFLLDTLTKLVCKPTFCRVYNACVQNKCWSHRYTLEIPESVPSLYWYWAQIGGLQVFSHQQFIRCVCHCIYCGAQRSWMHWLFVFPCMVSKNTQTPKLSLSADGAITLGSIEYRSDDVTKTFLHFRILNTIYRQSMMKNLHSPNLVGSGSWGPRYDHMNT